MSEPTNKLIALANAAHSKDYFEALGRFIAAYAHAEAEVHHLARKMTGMKDSKARILFAGMRLGEVETRLRQLMEEKGATKIYAEVDTCLNQLNLIAIQRHKLAHRMVHFDSTALRVSNWKTAKSLDNVEEDQIDLSELRDMRMDCIFIMARLLIVRAPAFRKELDRDELDMIARPWRYKPPKPKTPAKRRRKARKLRKRQPASSQA